MFEAFLDPEYGRRNRLVAAALAAIPAVVLAWMWIAGVSPGEMLIAAIGTVGLVIVARWILPGMFLAFWGLASVAGMWGDNESERREKRSRRRR